MSSDTILENVSPATSGRHHLILEQLAPELLILVASQLPDLVSLDSFIRASPAFFRLFEENAVKITEAVLLSGHTHGHIRVILRIVALIRSSTIPAPNLTYFKNWATEHAMYYRVRSSRNAISPLYLEKGTTPEVIRGILATNRKITSLALDCIKFYLARFQTLKPEHPYPIEEYWTCAQYLNSRKVQAGKYLAKGSAPPTWSEEQRVIRAFWRIQLFYEIKHAASNLPWPEDDITTLLTMHPMQIYGDQSLRLGLEGGELHPEYQEIYSVYEYVRDAHGQDAKHASAFRPTALVHGEVLREWPTATPGEYSWKELIYPSMACAFHFHTYSRHGKTRGKLEWFRQWGFAFWSFRMCDFGLLQDYRDSKPNEKNLLGIFLFAWDSIIPVEETSKPF